MYPVPLVIDHLLAVENPQQTIINTLLFILRLKGIEESNEVEVLLIRELLSNEDIKSNFQGR